jgi:hypothetical protein
MKSASCSPGSLTAGFPYGKARANTPEAIPALFIFAMD